MTRKQLVHTYSADNYILSLSSMKKLCIAQPRLEGIGTVNNFRDRKWQRRRLYEGEQQNYDIF